MLPPRSETIYKGLALVTPGGDVVYAIDPDKQKHWHAQLCAVLQQRLKLSESPLFLTPSHTATVDRWIDPQSQTLCMAAEVHPYAWRYRALFEALFDVPAHQWRRIAASGQDTGVVQGYREQFPQLWQSHNLVIRADVHQQPQDSAVQMVANSYVLHLFIASHSPNASRVLEVLHQVLEQVLTCPYTLKIIDVTQRPDQAEAAQVLATPTLLRVWPRPTRKVVGELNQVRILQLLMM